MKKTLKNYMTAISMMAILLMSGCESTEEDDANPKDEKNPSVISFSIPDDDDVSVNTTISVTFSEGIDLDTTEEGFLILYGLGSQVAEIRELSEDGKTVTFTPDNPLSRSRGYSIHAGIKIKDLAGNRLDKTYSSYFVTEL